MALLANPTARTQTYVSSVSYGGIPIGNDSTGDGSIGAPFLTLDKGLAAAPAGVTLVGGGVPTLLLNGDPSSPTSYVATSLIAVNGRRIIQSVYALGAKISGDGPDQVISLIDGANLTLRDIIVDPSLNNGGAAASGIKIPTTGTVTLTCSNVTFQNWTAWAVNGSGPSNGTFVFADCNLNGGTVNGGIYLNAMGTGSVTISGGACALTAQNLDSSGGGVVVLGTAGNTATFSCASFDVDVVLDTSLVGIGTHYGIRVLDIDGAAVTGGTHSISGAPGSRTGACVLFEQSSATINSCAITGATGYNNTNGGYIFAIGLENSGVPTVGDACSISGCTISAGSFAIAGNVHGAFLGALSNSSCTNTTITNTALAFVDKGTTGTTASGLTISGFTSSAIRSKGTTNATYSGESSPIVITQTAGYATASMINGGRDSATGTDTTGLSFDHITLNNNGGTTTVFLVKTASDTATPTNNVYNQTAGSLSANPWQWGSANCATLPAWQAIEPTATGTAP